MDRLQKDSKQNESLSQIHGQRKSRHELILSLSLCLPPLFVFFFSPLFGLFPKRICRAPLLCLAKNSRLQLWSCAVLHHIAPLSLARAENRQSLAKAWHRLGKMTVWKWGQKIATDRKRETRWCLVKQYYRWSMGRDCSLSGGEFNKFNGGTVCGNSPNSGL